MSSIDTTAAAEGDVPTTTTLEAPIAEPLTQPADEVGSNDAEEGGEEADIGEDNNDDARDVAATGGGNSAGGPLSPDADNDDNAVDRSDADATPFTDDVATLHVMTATEPINTPDVSPVKPATTAAAAAAAAPDSHKKVVFTQPSPVSAASRRGQSPSQRTVTSAGASRVDLTPQPVQSATHAANTDATEVYTRAETERIAAAAAALTPNTVLSLFRRGGDNSHTNRMEAGSYSRYLLSTDHMPPVVLNETFYGEQPTLGTVPRNTVKPRATDQSDEGMSDEAAHQQLQQQHAQASEFNAPSSASTSARGTRRASVLANSQMNATWNSTTGSGTLRREVEMLDADTFAELDEIRHQRRQNPRKGKPAQPQLDYVYYNHKSKGFYIPHDPSPDTTMLHYNHMYSFGDGTRFAPLTTSPTAGGQQQQPRQLQVGLSSGREMHRRNPHAAPPRTFAETRGCTFPLTASQRQLNAGTARSGSEHHSGRAHSSKGATFHTTTSTGSAAATTMRSEAEVAQQQRRRQRAEIQNGTSSLRTAKSIDLARLHRTQCPRPRTIEDVLADQQQNYLSSNAGAPHPLVHDITREVQSGKLEWEEVPASFQTALTAAATAAAQRSARDSPSSINMQQKQQQQQQQYQSYPRTASAGRPQRTASLSQPLNGLVDVMGHLRPVPAIAAATATRGGDATSLTTTTAAMDGDAVAGSMYATSTKGRSGKAVAAATQGTQLPVISRLNHPK